MTELIYEPEIGAEYVSLSTRTRVVVKGFCKHAQDCSQTMVLFENINPTVDSAAGTLWCIDYGIFLKRFRVP